MLTKQEVSLPMTHTCGLNQNEYCGQRHIMLGMHMLACRLASCLHAGLHDACMLLAWCLHELCLTAHGNPMLLGRRLRRRGPSSPYIYCACDGYPRDRPTERVRTPAGTVVRGRKYGVTTERGGPGRSSAGLHGRWLVQGGVQSEHSNGLVAAACVPARHRACRDVALFGFDCGRARAGS